MERWIEGREGEKEWERFRTIEIDVRNRQTDKTQWSSYFSSFFFLPQSHVSIRYVRVTDVEIMSGSPGICGSIRRRISHDVDE